MVHVSTDVGLPIDLLLGDEADAAFEADLTMEELMGDLHMPGK